MNVGVIKDPLRKAEGRLRRSGRPLHLPTWLSQQDLDYVVKQFQKSGSRGGVKISKKFTNQRFFLGGNVGCHLFRRHYRLMLIITLLHGKVKLLMPLRSA
jgi:hypothetical protein